MASHGAPLDERRRESLSSTSLIDSRGLEGGHVFQNNWDTERRCLFRSKRLDIRSRRLDWNFLT